MARSHHRKKHKQHLRTYQNSKEVTVKAGKAKVTVIFTLLGLALGLGIAYFAVNTVLAIFIGAVAGGLVGYLIGKKMDENP